MLAAPVTESAPLRAPRNEPQGSGLFANLREAPSQERPALVALPPSGRGVVEQLSAPLRPADPLLEMVGEAAEQGPRPMGVLQARLAQQRRHFQRIDAQSRFLMARDTLSRGTGFDLRFFPNLLDLTG